MHKNICRVILPVIAVVTVLIVTACAAKPGADDKRMLPDKERASLATDSMKESCARRIACMLLNAACPASVN